MPRHTPEHITFLAPNEVFVFGSNLAGLHGGGAALLARERFGAVSGEGIGHHGQTYAIPTKDERIETLPLDDIAEHVSEFLDYARHKPDLTFLVTRIGCGLAGYTPADIAPFFSHSPANVILPASFQ